MNWEDFPRVRSQTTGSGETGYSYSLTVDTENEGVSVTNYDNRSQPNPVTSKSTGDVVTPNFSKRIAAGEIINNNFKSETITTNETPVTSIFRYREWTNVNGNLVRETLQGGAGFKASSQAAYLDTIDPGPMASEALNEAVQSAHANVSQSEMLALASAAESTKTVDFVADSMRRAYKIFKAVRKFDLKYLKKQISAKELAQRYMEARYALRPLIYEVKGAVEVVNKTRQHTRSTAYGYANRSDVESDVLTDRYLYWDIAGNFNREHRITVSAKAGVLCSVEVTNAALLGLDQILETVWDLTPFSFICDWFVDVGRAIAAVSPDAGVTQLASWCTVRTNEEWINRVSDSYMSADPASGMTGSATFEPTTWKRRELVERTADPALYVWPMASLSVDSYKILDLGIILERMFVKK